MAAWYALPDLVHSKGVRVLIKVGGVAGVGALVVRRAVAEQDASRAGEPHSMALDLTAETAAATAREFSARSRTAVGHRQDGGHGARLLGRARPGVVRVAVLGVLAGSVATTVLVERGIFRLGERWRGAGWQAPHTMIGLTLGALAAVTGAGRSITER